MNYRALLTIARNTFREAVRDKIFYALIAFAILLIGASLLAGSVSLGQETRVIQSFGLTAIFIFTLIIAIFTGTQLLWREMERRTIFLVLTKPISRETFYLGKFLGLAVTVGLAVLVMGAIFLAVLNYQTDAALAPALMAIIFIALEAWLIIAVSMFFGSFTAPLSSAVYTFCLILIGHASSTIWLIANRQAAPLKQLLELIYYAFPNLEKFNLRNEVIYSFLPDVTQIMTVSGYFLGYLAALLFLGIVAFRKHEF